MNRLIIIGNGFDLAHGLPTRYSDFLKWYWSKLNFLERNNFGVYYYGDKILELKLYNPIQNCDSYHSLIDNLQNGIYRPGENYLFMNDFFMELNDNSLINWVDIEMFYKNKLEKAFHSQNRTAEIKKLNAEFADVRELFEKYLIEKVQLEEETFTQNPSISKVIKGWVEGESFTLKFIENLPKHLLKIESFKGRLGIDNKFTENDDCTYILNFNYTDTVAKYISNQSKTRFNYIHGYYRNTEFPIIFGYGDESDELFPLLERANNNDYLQYTKSVSYLKKQNYTNLMNFIESDNFIVEVMGHSLAISDRTLLKTIFENENCQYIFMYYHQREDGTTDFFDKSVNISRHFSDKKMMRKKVAPEVFCCPLPQNK